MATPRYLSATNGFIPQATGQAIAYVRDKGRFKINQYAQMIKAPKPVVTYAVLDPDQPVRVVTDQEFDWPSGDDSPRGENNMGNFVWNEVRVFRRAYPYRIGYQELETAQGWNPKAFFNASIMTQAMTNLTQRFVTLMETTGNWSNQFSDSNSLSNGAGTWDKASNDPASANYLAIKKALLGAVRKIVLSTNGMVSINDLILIVSPGLALAMAETPEIHSYLEKQINSIKVLDGSNPDVSANWGLPPKLYGVRVVVEDAVIVNVRPTSTGTAATLETQKVFIKKDTSAVVCSRVGGLDGNYGSPSFSTFQRYYYKYLLAVESFDEPIHKRRLVRVVDQFKEVLAAFRSGWLITNTL